MAKKKPLYRVVLQEAWHFTWHHPVLWLLGFFAMAVGHTGVFEIVSSVADTFTNNAIVDLVPVEPVSALALPTIFGSRLLGTLGNGLVAVVYLGVAILIVIAAVGSTGAIIHAAKRFKKTRPEKLTKAWHYGVSRFWPLFWLNVGKKVILALLVWILGIPLLALVGGAGGAVSVTLFFVLFIVAVFAGLGISFLTNFASMYVVLEEEHLGRAIADAWKLFTKHWLVSIEMALLLLVVQIAVLFLALAGFAILFFPFMAFWLAATILGLKILVVVGGVLSYTLGILFILWLLSWYSTFAISAWTILYTHLQSPRAKIKSVIHSVITAPFGK